MNSHGHSERSLLGICARKREPCDIQRMGKGPKRLRPDHSKVAQTLIADLREDAIEDVGQRGQAESENDCFTAAIAINEIRSEEIVPCYVLTSDLR